MGRWSWRAALRRTPGASRPDTRTVELGDGLAVVYERDEDGAVTESYVGIRGKPSRVVLDVARERLSRAQAAAGEPPWFPEVSARLAGPQPGAPAAGDDDAAPA